MAPSDSIVLSVSVPFMEGHRRITVLIAIALAVAVGLLAGWVVGELGVLVVNAVLPDASPTP